MPQTETPPVVVQQQVDVVQAAATPIEEPEVEQVTISISCVTILDNMDKFKKTDLLPANGMILSTNNVEFYEGLTVFDCLKSVAEENNVVLKYKSFPSVYLEEIAGIGEFDCGSASGWQYRVNGQIPSQGVGAYKLNSGDKIEILYTCDLGKDL